MFNFIFTIKFNERYQKSRADFGGGADKKQTERMALSSSRATVHIQVNDVNEYAPVFKEKSYQAAAVEGRRYESILRVEAVDADCSPQFSQICSYEIVTPNVPFTVDKDGENRAEGPVPRGSQGRPSCRWGTWAIQAGGAKCPSLGSFNNRHLCLTVVGAGKAEIRVLAHLGSLEGLLPGSLHPPMVGRQGTLVSSSSNEDTSSSAGGPPHCFT